MNTYINKDNECIYIQLDVELDSSCNKIGTTWDDYLNGCWVLLNEEQVSFKEANPDASVEEVFNMQIAAAEEPVTEESIEDSINQKRVEMVDYMDTVRAFYYNNNSLQLYDWLTLKDRCNTAIRNNVETVVLESIEIDPKLGLYLLDKIQKRDSEFTEVLKRKIEELNNCKTSEDVESFDIKSDFPTGLSETEDSLRSEVLQKESEKDVTQAVNTIKMVINTLPLSDSQALTVKRLYPNWQDFVGQSLSANSRVLYEDNLYKVLQDIDDVVSNPLESTELYQAIK